MSSQIIEVKTQKNNKVHENVILVKRNNLYIKSPMFEEFFKNTGSVITTEYNFKDEEFEVYKMPTVADTNKTRNFAYTNLSSFVNREGWVNASFFRVKGISQGVNFSISGVNSKEQIETLKKELPRICQEFYKEFMKPISYRIELNITESA